MHARWMTAIVLLSGLALSHQAVAQAVGTAVTYQGRLDNGGLPATGPHDLRFTLYDALSGGSPVGPTLCVENLIPGSDGTFTTVLDFGNQFTGPRRWLQIDVRADVGTACGVAAGYTPLLPRQELTPAPHALWAEQAGASATLGGNPPAFYTNASNLSAGTLPSARLAGAYTGAVTFSNAANAFSGSGAGLTSLNASNIASGSIADARLSSNVALLSGSQTFSGQKSFSAASIFNAAGAPFSVASSGLVANLNADLLDGLSSAAFAAATHSHDASAVTTGVLSDARLSSNIPRLNAAANFTSTGSFGGSLGVGTSSPSSLLELRTADPQLRVRNTNDTGGGVILNTFGSLQLGLFNPSGAAWGVVPAGGYRSVLAMDNQGRVGSTTNTSAGPVYRNLLDDGSGRLGIGTSSPGAPLDVRVNATQGLQVRLDGGLIPGIAVVGGGGNAGVMRMRNAIEVWPSDDATRAGKVDVRAANGAATVTLDGSTGNIAANNLAAVKGVQTFTESRDSPRGFIGIGQFAVLDTVSATAPANGFYMIFATLTCHIDTTALINGKASMELKLDENTPGQSGILTNTRFTCKSGDHDGSTLNIVWTKPVVAGTTYTFQTSTYVYRDYGSGLATGHYWSSTLHVLFVPNALP